MLKQVFKLVAVLLLSVGFAWADSGTEFVRQKMLRLQPDLVIEQVSPAAKPGWFQVQVRGGQFLYVDEAVEYILHGQLYHVQGDSTVNLTEQAQQRLQAAKLKTLSADEMVIFPAKNKRASITVFTDVDCSYCQKLHAEVEQLNALGVEVRYLAYPRQGLSGSTYNTMVSIWCADDPLVAMTKAKRQQRIEKKTCKHPIDKHFALGRMFGVQGTPTIILDSGELLPGYLPAEQLAARAIKN